jgi:hypothetical protein
MTDRSKAGVTRLYATKEEALLALPLHQRVMMRVLMRKALRRADLYRNSEGS